MWTGVVTWEGLPRFARNDSAMKQGFVYILANKNNTTLYVGVTSNLVQRVQQHKDKHHPNSFSARYNVDKLVYFETFERIGEAIKREKQLKAGSRAKKVALIESTNPAWEDLTPSQP